MTAASDWQTGAACVGADPATFFPDDRPGVSDWATPRHICHACPVRLACLDDAMHTEALSDRYGMRGGLSPAERTSLYRGAEAVVLAILADTTVQQVAAMPVGRIRDQLIAARIATPSPRAAKRFRARVKPLTDVELADGEHLRAEAEAERVNATRIYADTSAACSARRYTLMSVIVLGADA